MNIKLLRIKRLFPYFFHCRYDDELRRRKVCRLWRKVSKEIDRQMNEAWGWDIDRDKYDALAVIKAEYEDLLREYLEL